MSDNPYQTPGAILNEEPKQRQEFYIVSSQKFAVLFFGTVGLYIIYWFYKNWRYYKRFHQLKLLPVMRGIFSIFFAHSLFSRIDKSLHEKSIHYPWKPKLLATAYVLASVLGHVFDRLAMAEVGSPLTDFLSLCLLPVTFFILAPVQTAINTCENDLAGIANDNLTTVNFLWIAVGILLWLFIFLALADTLGLIDLEQ